MIKTCIISCGMIANNAHIPAYRTFPEDYELAGVCDVHEHIAMETAKRHGIPKYYTDAKKMLAELRPDLVSVCVPNALHKQYAMLALQMGAHVLCEKPLAFRLQDAEELYACAENSKKMLMACQNRRYSPDRLAAKRFIENGGLDDIYYGEIVWIRRRGIPTWGTFHMKKISCGGAFADIGVHMVDSLLWLTGNPKVRSVYAFAGQNHKYEACSFAAGGALTGAVYSARPFEPEEMDVEDFADGMITFENGSRVHFKIAWAANMPEQTSIRLVSRRAGLDLPGCTVYTGADCDRTLETEPLAYYSDFAGHMYLADHVRSVLKGEAEPAVKPEETINVAAVLELFYRSAEERREVFASELHHYCKKSE